MKDLGFLSVFGFLVLLISCNPEEDDASLNNQSGDDYPSGTSSYFINDQFFQSGAAKARFNSNDQLAIVLENQDWFFPIVIEEFQGEGSYRNYFPEPEDFFSANYFRQFEGGWYAFGTDKDDGNDTVFVYSYDKENGMISGFFDMVAYNVRNNSNTLKIQEGEFTDIPIIELADAQPGSANYFYRNLYNSSDSVWAEITNNFQIIIHFPLTNPFYANYDHHFWIEEPRIKTYIGLGDVSPWFLDYKALNDSRHEYDSRSNSFEWDLDLNGGTVSGRSRFDYWSEFEVSFNQIPITKYPLEMSDAVIDLHIGEEIIQFSEIYYEYADSGILRNFEFEATNDKGQKFVLYRLGDPTFEMNSYSTFPGLDCELRFFENEFDLQPAWKVVGFFGDYGDRKSGFVAVGFNSDTVNFRSSNIPIVQ